MIVLSKTIIQNKRTIISVDEDFLSMNPKKVRIDGKEYDYHLAYDINNTFMVDAVIQECNEIEFIT